MDSMHTIPEYGRNNSAEKEDLAAHMHENYELRTCKCSLGNTSVASGLFEIRHDHQVTQFVIGEPARLLRLPYPAPPPKLHYSTWWRSVSRRLYRAHASSVLKKFQADLHESTIQI